MDDKKRAELAQAAELLKERANRNGFEGNPSFITCMEFIDDALLPELQLDTEEETFRDSAAENNGIVIPPGGFRSTEASATQTKYKGVSTDERGMLLTMLLALLDSRRAENASRCEKETLRECIHEIASWVRQTGNSTGEVWVFARLIEVRDDKERKTPLSRRDSINLRNCIGIVAGRELRPET